MTKKNKSYDQMVKDHEILFADGFDDAVMGIAMDLDLPRVIYSKEAMVEIMVKEYEEMDDVEDPYTEAMEFLEYNVWGAYVGTGTPIYINEGNKEETEENASYWGINDD